MQMQSLLIQLSLFQQQQQQVRYSMHSSRFDFVTDGSRNDGILSLHHT
jgi:hypothetical protein